MSTTADTYVRARIDTNTKERAASALEAMGLSISDAIRLLMLRIADEHRLPFDVKVPNVTTKKAIAELEAGKGEAVTPDTLFKIASNSKAMTTGVLARLLQRISPQYFPADKLCFFADDDAGPGQSLGPLFTQLPFDHLFFTGSPQTGQAVMANAAIHLTPVTLELGGKSPAIVAPDFALDQAAERLLWAKLLNAGQICTNVDYLLLPEGREQAFIEHAQRIAAARFPNLLNGDYTAIIDQRQYDRLQAMLQDAVAQGAQAVPLCPGQQGDAARRIMPPVALLGVHDGMQVMQREIFGPLLPIRTYRHKEEVVQYINDRPHPLALYLFSHERGLQDYYLRQTLSGGVTLNDTLLHAGQHSLPFGGVGHSGMGHYHGREGFLTFSKLRPVFRQGPLRTVDFLQPPYAGLASKLLNVMLWRNR